MKKTKQLYLLPRLLDCQIIDSEGIRCGKVDDVELQGEPGKPLMVTNIFVGSGLWQKRRTGLLHHLFDIILPDTKVNRIHLKYIKEVDPLITLNTTAAHVRLEHIDRKLAKYFAKIPGGA